MVSSNTQHPDERRGLAASGDSFVYRRALLIIPSDFLGSHNCYPETAAMLYNLSLSFHVEGHLSNNSTLLDKALKAYKIALALRRRPKVCRKLQCDNLLEIAISNNMAMIHQEFMEFERARACFVSVSSSVAITWEQWIFGAIRVSRSRAQPHDGPSSDNAGCCRIDTFSYRVALEKS
jgi:hypothetical protein